jgi:subtilisin family serine protease
MAKKEFRDYFTYRKLLSLILLILIGVYGNDILAGFADEYVFDTIYLPPHADSLSIDTIEFTKEDVNPKLDSALARVAAEARVSINDALTFAQNQSLKISDSRVQVEIVTHAEGVENAINAVIEAGGEVTGVGYNDTLIQAWLPVSVLETVAAHDDIYFIRRPTKGFPTSGNSETEALDLMNALAWHGEGIMGAGVRVGIIDLGFKDYTKLLGTDLPAHVTVKNFVDHEDDTKVDGTTMHGTACAEIIHDVAPEASLYLAKIGTLVDLEEAVNWLKDTHRVDIISISLGYYNLSPGDGTGILSDLVRDARNAGILWVTSAGNNRESHWGGLYYDPDGNNYHNFNGSQEINYFGPGDGSGNVIYPGNALIVTVRWDDWTNVNQDYDLYLLRWNGASWEQIAKSTNIQNGQPGQRPTEAAVVYTFGDPAPYGFLIKRVNSTRNVNFEIFAFLGNFRLDELVHSRSIGNLADAPDAMTVAALDAALPCPQEPYSSEGPTNGPGGTATGGFIKPDISGFANVSCECYSNPFSGTSAATPHVAGAATLVLSAYPDFTPDQLQSFLEERAIDMGATGMDTQFGHGRLDLGEPPQPYYCDDDQDGYVDMLPDGSCSGAGCAPTGCRTTPGTDCDDTDPLVHPGALESCDNLDNDCDSEIDEGGDSDGDTVDNCYDNCPNIANGGQSDLDGDGIGDVCDDDDDNDGMPDDWEISYGLDPRSDDASEDADGDGFANLIECRKGTDPTDPDDCPSVDMPWIQLLLLDD